MVYCIVLGFAFLIFGFIFSTRRLLSKISGWTAMSIEEQQKIRVLPLCQNIGLIICLTGILFLTAGFFPTFREDGIRLAMVGWFALCIADLVYQ